VSNENIMIIREENIVKVIVIDDSAFMRKSLKLILESDPEIRVIATARDVQEGMRKSAN
jgi:two-component system chemotaxis response regulator CheB